MVKKTFIEAEQQIIINVINGHHTNLRPEEMQGEGHRIILKHAQSLRDEGVAPDIIALHHRLKERNELSLVGGLEYLDDLKNNGTAVNNLDAYENIVRDENTRAGLIRHANAILKEAEHGVSTSDILVMAQTRPLKLSTHGFDRGTCTVQDESFNVLETLRNRRGSNKLIGLETPWRLLNKMTSGLRKKDLIVIAGRPGFGKTVLGAQIAEHAAWKDGPVFIGSLEMDRSSLVERMIVGRAKVDASKARDGYLNPSEFARIESAVEQLQDLYPIVINDTSRMTAQDLRMAISQANLKYNGLSIAVIDYLGLIAGNEYSNRQRYQEVGDITKIMKATAKDLDIPIVLISQLNRSCESRENKRPILADLRESGDIEQDADLIIMLYRDECYCPTCINPKETCMSDHVGEAELIVRKQRKGPIGAVLIHWHDKYTMFADRARDN